MYYTALNRTITDSTIVHSVDHIGQYAQFFDVYGYTYTSAIVSVPSSSSTVLSANGHLPTEDGEIFGLVLVPSDVPVVPVVPVVNLLKDYVFADIGKRTALVALKKENDKLATSPDDSDTLDSFYVAACMRVATIAGAITSVTTTNVSDIEDFIPRRLWTAITYYMMMEWFKSIGEIDLGKFYEEEFDNESSRYRFTPDTNSFATRTYRAF